MSCRPSKYHYSSPLKSVIESPGKVSPKKNELSKKTKKKVKLFSSSSQVNGTSRGHKSFGEVEESLARGALEGIDRLPSTPSRSIQMDPSSPFLKSRVNTSCDSEYTPPERGGAGSRIAKRISARFTPSPQAFSLSDFLTPQESRRGGRKGKCSRSPSKAKASTPIDGGCEAPPTIDEGSIARVSNLGLRLAELDLENKESFPDIGDTVAVKGKRRIKPIQLGGPTPSKESGGSLAFGQVVERQESVESPFRVAEVERKTVDDRGMVRESVTRKTPLKLSSMPAVTPLKPASVSRSNSISSCCPTLASPLLVSHRPTLALLAHLYSYILLNNLMPNLVVEVYFLLELLLLDLPAEQDCGLQEDDEDSFLSSVHNCVFFSCQVLHRILPLLAPLDGTTIRLLAENPRVVEFLPSLADDLSTVHQDRAAHSPAGPRRETKGLQNVSFQSETDNRSNFPSNPSFHDFKKQRDKFYSLIRRWGEESRGPDYDFSLLVPEVEQVKLLR